MKMTATVCVVCCAGMAMAGPPGSKVVDLGSSLDPFIAGGGVSDDFDGYDLGDLCGQSSWEEWDGSEDVCAVVSDDVAFSGTQSMMLEGAVGGNTGLGDDTVHQVAIEGGQWTFSAQTYVPEDAEGAASVILLNTYPPTVNADWSIVLTMDSGLGTITTWLQAVTVLQKGEWVELRCEIDLDADTVDYYYAGELFASESWTQGVDCCGMARIQAIDLYGGEPGAGGTTGTYLDDVSLVPAGGCPADCDGNGELNVLDFVCFQLEWQDQTDKGDCDGNGSYDILDFVCYQQVFVQGCP